MQQGIFVSYRRQDSQSAAGRLTDHLKEHLRTVSIFRDVETIEPGMDFVEAIERALRSCGVLIAVIGPRWVDAADADGARRLDDPNDYTRLEIATALTRTDVRVIPVLVEGATMPTTGQLPEDLEPLARRNAIELSDKRWDFDVSLLVDTLRKALELPEPKAAEAPQTTSTSSGKTGSRKKWWIGGGLAFLILAALIGEQDGGLDPVPPMPSPQPLGATGGGVSVAPATGTINLTGLWRDSDGGMHEIVQRGSELVFQGQTPDGYVAGTGTLSGRQGQTTYMFNGYPLRSTFVVSADGQRMDVTVIDPATNERDATQLFRVR